MPLNNIPMILSPDLLHAMSSAGHGDQIVLADAHFPTSFVCRAGPREIRADGHGIPVLLEAILKFFPLDTYDNSIAVMRVLADERDVSQDGPNIWKEYEQIIQKYQPSLRITHFDRIERFDFYKEAERAYAVVATGETSQYGNIMIKKGIVKC